MYFVTPYNFEHKVTGYEFAKVDELIYFLQKGQVDLNLTRSKHLASILVDNLETELMATVPDGASMTIT